MAADLRYRRCFGGYPVETICGQTIADFFHGNAGLRSGRIFCRFFPVGIQAHVLVELFRILPQSPRKNLCGRTDYFWAWRLRLPLSDRTVL